MKASRTRAEAAGAAWSEGDEWRPLKKRPVGSGARITRWNLTTLNGNLFRMMKGPSPRKRPAKRTRFAGPLTFLLAAAAGGLAIALWTVGGPANLPTPGPAMPDQRESSKITFDKVSLTEGKSAVRTANVQIVDLDRDGLNDILVCDAARNAVILYRQIPGGQFEERVLGDNLKCPAHATVVDLDKDGDLDVVVAVLGSIFPWDELVGG